MSTLPLHTDHARLFEHNRFVYPVLSRRSGGISIGVNLNPDKICNFDCIYCQVDRRSQSETRFVETAALRRRTPHDARPGHLRPHLRNAKSSRDVPPHLRRLNDIAFSGDGEPTTYKNFDELIAAVRRSETQACDPASMIHVRRQNGADHQRQHVPPPARPARPGDPRREQRRNLGQARCRHRRVLPPHRAHPDSLPPDSRQHHRRRARPAARHPIALHARERRAAIAAELEAFCDRLNEITAAGGQLKLVQIYTVARRPAESFVAPLTDAEVDAIVALVKERTGLNAQAYYGNSDY